MNSDQGPWQFDSAVRSEGLDDHRIGLPGVPLSTKHLEDAFFCYDEGVAKGIRWGGAHSALLGCG